MSERRKIDRRPRQLEPIREHLLGAVTGGRKAGKGQQEYLVVKLEELVVTSVAPNP